MNPIKFENNSFFPFILAIIFFLLAILFISRTTFAQRCISKFNFASDTRAPYIFFGVTMLLWGASILILQLPAPYRIIGLVTTPVSGLLLFAFFLYLLYSLFKNKK